MNKKKSCQGKVKIVPISPQYMRWLAVVSVVRSNPSEEGLPRPGLDCVHWTPRDSASYLRQITVQRPLRHDPSLVCLLLLSLLHIANCFPPLSTPPSDLNCATRPQRKICKIIQKYSFSGTRVQRRLNAIEYLREKNLTGGILKAQIKMKFCLF